MNIHLSFLPEEESPIWFVWWMFFLFSRETSLLHSIRPHFRLVICFRNIIETRIYKSFFCRSSPSYIYLEIFFYKSTRFSFLFAIILSIIRWLNNNNDNIYRFYDAGIIAKFFPLFVSVFFAFVKQPNKNIVFFHMKIFGLYFLPLFFFVLFFEIDWCLGRDLFSSMFIWCVFLYFFLVVDY